MEQINSNTVNGLSPFIQKHSVLIRIWHWLTFIIISGLIVTVILTSTVLNQRKNSVVVQDQLKAKGVTVTEDQAFAVSHAYEDIIWSMHKGLGYALAILLFSRILIELVQPSEEKVRSRVRNATGLFKGNINNKKDYRNYLVVKYGHLLFYFLLLIMVLTGLGLAFGRELSFSRGLHNILKELHSIGQVFMYAFVLFHLCSVIVYDIDKAKGIVSGMINGN